MFRIKFLVFLPLLALLLSVPGVAHGQDSTLPPHVFAGGVVLDGVAAADGTVVRALILGVERGRGSVSGGRYIVPVSSGGGSEIIFIVGSVQASESGLWAMGGATALDLSASSSGTPAPHAAPGAGSPTVLGAPGRPGPAGERGPTGSAGSVGAAGPPGPTGPEGPPGIIGLRGPAGARGSDAPLGDPGPAGPAGPTGLQGEVGPDGGVTVATFAILLSLVGVASSGGLWYFWYMDRRAARDPGLDPGA